MKKELLIKYLNNQCTDYEVEEVLSWIKTNAFNEEDKNWSFEVWNSFQDGNNKDDDESFTLVFDKIQERINGNNKKSNITENRTVKFSVFTGWITKVAAILFIPVLSILFYTISARKIESAKYARLAADSLEVIAPVGAMTVVQFSDGSEVRLNYGSKIKYPHIFSGDKREVSLIGEGFFKIAHNPERPFIVKAGRLNIKAVGTTFNVLAYNDNDVIETTLVTGKVIIEQVKKGGKTEDISTMKPGGHLNYNLKTGAISVTEGDTEKYISWTEGKLIFSSSPILKVTERLSRMFNVDFEVKDEIKDYIYTVTFSGESLHQILELMSLATPITYKIVPRKQLTDGTFSKQRIVLSKR